MESQSAGRASIDNQSAVRSSRVSWISSSQGSLDNWGVYGRTGKGIYAIGDATLRAVERVMIRRRLAVISSHFPHDDSATIDKLDQMYHDLLELSRPGYYRSQTRRRAVDLLVTQIERGETFHLKQALLRWPSSEVQLILSEVMKSIHPPPSVSRAFSKRKGWIFRPPLPILRFIWHLVQQDNTMSMANIDGFIEDLSELARPGADATMRRGVIELICEQFEAGQCGPIAHSIAGLPAKEIELFLSEFALTVGTGVAIKALAFIRDFDECDVDDATIQLVGRAVGPHFLHDDLADVQRMDEFYSPLLDILNSERYGTRARNFSVCVIWRHLERAGIDTFVGILKNCSLTHTEAVMSAFMDSIDGLIMRSAASEMQDGWTPSSALPLLAVLVKIVQLHKAKVAGTSTHTDNMCKYILEYAKDNARPQDVRQRSLQLVALQVCYGHASPLLSHLAQWPPADTARFVTDLVDIVPHTEANLVSSKDGSFLSIKAALLDDPAHPYGLVYRKHHIYALIEFHSQLIQLNEPTCRAVLDTGYLDVVLGLCMRGNVRAKCPFASCDLALQKCASYGDMYRGMIVGHPLFHLWPSWVPFSLRPAAKDIDVQARASAWRRVDARDVYWHHSQIRSLVDENFWDPPPTNELELFEYCLDLFEFSRREFYGDIAGHADRVLRMFVREPKHEDAYTKACKAMKVQPALAYLFQRNNPLPSEPRIPSTLEVHPSAILA